MHYTTSVANYLSVKIISITNMQLQISITCIRSFLLLVLILNKANDLSFSKCNILFRFSTFKVSLGGIDRLAKEPNEIIKPVTSAIYHERYNEDMVWNDIGLLTLSEPVELSIF